MKKTAVYTFCFLMLCCTKQEHKIIGEWKVLSNFHRAIYNIELLDNKLVGRVIYYNDDTTELRATNTNSDLFLFDLKSQNNNTYVDAISGETTLNNHATTLEVIHKDTLITTTYYQKKPIKEIWIRTK